MNTVVNFITSGNGTVSLFVVHKNKMTSCMVDTGHPNHRKVVGLLKEGRTSWTDEAVEKLLSLADLPKTVEAAKQTLVEKATVSKKNNSLVGTAEVRDGQVYVNNVPVHNVVSDRIVEFALAGLPVEPILRFLELLLENPSSKAQEELYDFLANRSLPLTEDGHFLAYKRVRDDWKDIHSGTIDNSIGRVVEVERKAVDPNRAHECSYGLHVGALEYVRGYGHGGHVVIVKVNPRDCVSVPRDHNAQKLRVCRYEVLYEHDENQFLKSPLYTTDGAVASGKDWIEEESDPNLSDRYWEDGWEDQGEEEDDWTSVYDESYAEYSTWKNLDHLAMEAVSRNLIETRQSGRDMGHDALVDLLSEDDANQACS